MDRFLGLLASIPLWYLAVAFAYLIGLVVIAGITWPFRHLRPTSRWYISDAGFYLRIGVVISAIAIGFAILKTIAPSLLVEVSRLSHSLCRFIVFFSGKHQMFHCTLRNEIPLQKKIDRPFLVLRVSVRQ